MKKSLGQVKSVSTKSKQTKSVEEVQKYQNLFIASALSMSWQLAIVVLIPIIGGYELDAHLKSSPVFLIVGLVAALGGSIAVIFLAFREANQKVGK